MTKTHSVQEDLAPNLIPMVDIMFLLLLFFMLSADMGQRQLENVVLPGAKSARDDRKNEADGRLTINVFHAPNISCPTYAGRAVCREDRHWRTNVAGREFSDPLALAAYLKHQAPLKNPQDRVSERKVMIRVDSGAPYGLAQKAMNACAESGLYKIEVGAAVPPKERRS
jgi:biopolymer transport protein ExbD